MQAAYSLAVEAAIRDWFAEHRGLVQDAAPRRRAAELVDQAVRSIESSVNEELQTIERIQGARAAGGAQLLEAFRSRNVSLIVTVGEETKTRLDGALKKWGNLHVNDLTAKLLEVSDVSRARARFWARDQTLKLAAAVTRAKHESLGIVEYVWRTSGDGTVRPSHDALDGKTFRYDDPPETGTGVHNPGEDYQCRCHADPVLETAIDPRDVQQTPEAERAKAPPKPRKPRTPKPPPLTQVAAPADPARPLAPLTEAEQRRQAFALRARPAADALKELAAQEQLPGVRGGRDSTGAVRSMLRTQLAEEFPGALPRESNISNSLYARSTTTEIALKTADAYHNWLGDIVLRNEVVDEAAEALAGVAEGAGATPRGWGAIRTLFHEELHGLSRGEWGAYTGFGRFLEEAGTELNARHMVRQLGGSWSSAYETYAGEILTVVKAVAEAFGESTALAQERFRAAWAASNYTRGAERGSWLEVADALVDAMNPTPEQRSAMLRRFYEADKLLASGNFTISGAEGLIP